MLPITGNLTFVYRLSGLLAGLLLISSLAGLGFGWRGLYDAYPASLAAMVGQDIVTLVVGLPLLLGAVWLTRRSSAAGLLLWTGVLFYFAYSYYFFLVGGFNALFLAYVAIVATSLYALLALLFRIDAGALKAEFADRAPARRTAAFFIVTASLFVVMWGGLSVASVLAGTTPGSVVHLVVAIDGAVLLPLLLFGGLKLWRREPMGYVLGGLLLTKALVTGFTLALTSTLEIAWAGSVDPFQVFLAVLFGVMALIGLALLVPYLRNRGMRQPVAGMTVPPLRLRHWFYPARARQAGMIAATTTRGSRVRAMSHSDSVFHGRLRRCDGGRDTLVAADARGRRASDTRRSRVHLTLAAGSVGIRLLREASTILTRISTQTGPLGRLG